MKYLQHGENITDFPRKEQLGSKIKYIYIYLAYSCIETLTRNAISRPQLNFDILKVYANTTNSPVSNFATKKHRMTADVCHVPTQSEVHLYVRQTIGLENKLVSAMHRLVT
jgi:hypothetical protein